MLKYPVHAKAYFFNWGIYVYWVTSLEQCLITNSASNWQDASLCILQICIHVSEMKRLHDLITVKTIPITSPGYHLEECCCHALNKVDSDICASDTQLHECKRFLCKTVTHSSDFYKKHLCKWNDRHFLSWYPLLIMESKRFSQCKSGLVICNNS